jgi:phosphoribosyl 1,2-cyclic phosphate phosphodiesterase
MMRIEFLGSGGATTIPRPACHCRVCDEARARGVPYARAGPSIFLHGPDLLIDTPEEIKDQLNRSGIEHIAAGIYSHWHPDHTAGRRVWETRNIDLRGWPPQSACTEIYLPEQVAEDFKTWLGLQEHFDFLERHGVVRINRLVDGDSIVFGNWTVTSFRLAEEYVYAFLVASQRIRVLIVMDELHGWSPEQSPVALDELDLAVLPMGIVEFDVFSGERLIDPDHRVLGMEMTFAGTLDVVRRLGARRTILTHIEEMEQLSVDDLGRVERSLQAEGLNITFAQDMMTVDLGSS